MARRGEIGMKRRTLLAMIGMMVLSFSLSAHAWTSSWETIHKAAKNVRTFEADFVQTRSLKILKKPIVSRGKISFRRPVNLRWEYASPIKSVLLVRDGKVNRYIRRGKGFTADSSTRLQAMKTVLEEINRWLSGNFSASKTFQPILHQGPPVTVELTPIEPEFRRVIQKVVLSLGVRPGTLDSINIHEGDNNVTRIQFLNVRVNTNVPDSRFAAPQ